MNDLIYLPEPKLIFHHQQATEHPRDGLSLFGPYKQPRGGIRLGYVGPRYGIDMVTRFLKRLSEPIHLSKEKELRVPFPGFQGAFACKLDADFSTVASIDETALLRALSIREAHQRVHRVVSLYTSAVQKSLNEEDSTPDLWLVYVTPEVYKHCRPLQARLKIDDADVPFSISAKQAETYSHTPSLFEEDMVPLAAFAYEPNFHSQIKFRFLKERVVTQLVREETMPLLTDYVAGTSSSAQQSEANDVAWRFSTAIYYKVHGTPWKLAELRPRVCYLGLVFKKAAGKDERTACCAAQMFLDSGDGVVFRGAVGPWYNPEKRRFNLTRAAATELCRMAVSAYQEDFGCMPEELFIHGRAGFNEEEWEGFVEGAAGVGRTAAVRIKDAARLRLYANGLLTPLRGLAHIESDSSAVLLSSGFTPRIQTYMGNEVPVPLAIDVMRGKAAIETVVNDVLCLTKLNYNSCNFGDGTPVTLRFADNIGDILTAGKEQDITPLPFKHYI